jgi:hypothetical protein
MTRISIVLALCTGAILGSIRPPKAAAQSIVQKRDEAAGVQTRRAVAADAQMTRPFAGAVIGGAAGVLVGGIAGGYIGGNRCIDPGASDTCDWLRGMAVGTVVGVSLGAPLGAHLFNKREGALHWSLIASAAIAGVGFAAFNALEDDPPTTSRNTKLRALMIGVPVLQVIASTVIEVRTSRE